MNLTMERAPALAALGRLIGVIERKQTIPILGNVAIDADGEVLTIRGTDLEMEVIETVQATIATPGQITIPADKLHDIVRNADGGAQIAVYMEDGDPRVKVKSGRSNFKLPALPAVSFPQFKSEGLDAGFSIPARLLAEMIARVYWSIDSSDRNSIKGVVRLATYQGQLHTVGACSSGVSLRREPAPQGADVAVSLPAKVAQHLIRWLSEADGDAHVSTSSALIRIQHGASTYTAKLFDQPSYFPYEKNIHEEHAFLAQVAQDELAMALKRVMVMVDGKVRSVRLVFSEGQVVIKGRNDHSGESADEIGATYEGPQSTIIIDGAQLSAALGALKGDLVEFGFAEAPIEGEYKTGLLIIRAPVDPGLVVNIMQLKA